MHRHLLLAVDEESHHLGYHRRRRPHQRRILHGRIKGGISDGFAGARTLAIGGRPLVGAGGGPRWRFAVAAGAARRQRTRRAPRGGAPERRRRTPAAVAPVAALGAAPSGGPRWRRRRRRRGARERRQHPQGAGSGGGRQEKPRRLLCAGRATRKPSVRAGRAWKPSVRWSWERIRLCLLHKGPLLLR